jgi:hypothetical protein
MAVAVLYAMLANARKRRVRLPEPQHEPAADELSAALS